MSRSLNLKQFLLGVLLLMPALCVHAEESWSLARERDGIRVWTREISGYPIRAFKAEMTVKSNLAGLVNLIMDTENASRWVYRTDRIQLLKRDNEKATFVIRVETDFPWPLTNRDVVLGGSVVQEEKTGTVTIQSNSLPAGEYPESPDFVRMPDMAGTWMFRPIGNGWVEVTMIGRANPGGNIPAGVVNLIIHETPLRTMQAMRRVVGEARYQKTPVPQIREPANTAQ
jgi:hypothetical protein